MKIRNTETGLVLDLDLEDMDTIRFFIAETVAGFVGDVPPVVSTLHRACEDGLEALIGGPVFPRDAERPEPGQSFKKWFLKRRNKR